MGVTGDGAEIYPLGDVRGFAQVLQSAGGVSVEQALKVHRKAEQRARDDADRVGRATIA
jgi:hypothetical protein